MQTLLLLRVKRSECHPLETSNSVEVPENLTKYLVQLCSSSKAHALIQILHTPNLQFEICQISLNASGKLLAVAGTHQVAVVVLPRAGYSRLVPEVIDCKYALPLLFRLSFLPFIYLDVFKWVNSTMQQILQRPLRKLTGIRGEKLVQPYL